MYLIANACSFPLAKHIYKIKISQNSQLWLDSNIVGLFQFLHNIKWLRIFDLVLGSTCNTNSLCSYSSGDDSVGCVTGGFLRHYMQVIVVYSVWIVSSDIGNST